MKWFITLIFLHPFLYYYSGPGQSSEVANIELQRCQAVTGVLAYTLSGTINFARSFNDFKSMGDSIPKNYVLTISFKEGHSAVRINDGFEYINGDNEGELLLQKTIQLSQGDPKNYTFAFNIPAAAFNIPAGLHFLTPNIHLEEKNSLASVLHNQKRNQLLVNITREQKLTVWVKHILVDSLDAQGNLWDYFLINPVDGNPDLSWGIDYAGRSYYASKVRRNSFEYTDNEKKESFTLTISEGDTLTITVKDLDDLTPDDLIGAVVISPKISLSTSYDIISAKAGQVRQIEYSISKLP